MSGRSEGEYFEVWTKRREPDSEWTLHQGEYSCLSDQDDAEEVAQDCYTDARHAGIEIFVEIRPLGYVGSPYAVEEDGR